ncbi:ankyrin repeat domain-containing protein [Loktanella sp. M215]|uniref:ankyrin repeat domain-containing protein n=1 Tax=Loktanella sp. M215 TaxID=2675431 RepID=UPI001F41790E|nr:ankyrin repeat domain-containing protein [Loktanella sp. M215]MCF7698248.1 hypothetical protein [Loktanella sp. M215]
MVGAMKASRIFVSALRQVLTGRLAKGANYPDAVAPQSTLSGNVASSSPDANTSVRTNIELHARASVPPAEELQFLKSSLTAAEAVALMRGDRAVVAEILSDGRIDAISYHGDTALHIAVSCHDLELGRILVSHGAKTHVENSMGLTPYEMAARKGHDNAWSFLQNTSEGDLISGLSPFGAPTVASETGSEDCLLGSLDDDLLDYELDPKNNQNDVPIETEVAAPSGLGLIYTLPDIHVDFEFDEEAPTLATSGRTWSGVNVAAEAAHHVVADATEDYWSFSFDEDGEIDAPDLLGVEQHPPYELPTEKVSRKRHTAPPGFELNDIRVWSISPERAEAWVEKVIDQGGCDDAALSDLLQSVEGTFHDRKLRSSLRDAIKDRAFWCEPEDFMDFVWYGDAEDFLRLIMSFCNGREENVSY